MELGQFDFKRDPKKFFIELVNHALQNKNSEFEFIRNWNMCKISRMYKRGTKRVAKVFDGLAKKLVKEYAAKIHKGNADIETLIAIKQFIVCRDFYLKENAIAKDMMSEYRTYVFSGHILDQFIFNIGRRDDELTDYRKLPFRLF